MDQDLAKSGLTASDLMSRVVDNPEKAATNVPHSIEGYVIPYFNLYGRPVPFYRVRLFDFVPKYKQPKDSPSHVYFPPTFYEVARTSPYVILVEGEKKACLATKLGFPACALGGVDAWRNRTVTLPVDSELAANKSAIKAKLPAHTEATEDTSSIATGLQDLIDFLLHHKKHLIICYDSDEDVGIKPSVQRAAASLGFDLRFRGIPFSHIRQIVLPPINLQGTATAETTRVNGSPKSKDGKVGLDDFLIQGGRERFEELVKLCLAKKSAFPRHPNIRAFINQRLQKNLLPRKDLQQLSIGVLSDLDANGIRLSDKESGETYFFDFQTRKLIKTTFRESQDDGSGTPFGQFLYRRYGLSSADKRVIVWLAAQFTGEDPIEEVSPYRVIARARTNEDCVNYQISDSQYVRISSSDIELCDNGENGILFESGQVQPLDAERLQKELARQASNDGPLPNLWSDVLSSVRLRDQNAQRNIASLLYYMSPWLYRWRGMQLPVEMVIGESGSGKSTLCELRLSVITGETRLRNSPQDLKDWHASISNTGGLHVTDNVQLVDRNLRQRLSDEICRIITEPNPHIEQRKYYTNADLLRVPISAVFAITAIQQPFQNADLLQRSIILELDKTTNQEGGRREITYDSEWRTHQLERFGGREGWVAHHLLVLQAFFKLVDKEWQQRYHAKHRLINFEQAMILMAKVFGMDHAWIPGYLNGVVERTLLESDWTFEGLTEYVNINGFHIIRDPNRRVTAQDISEWAMISEDFKDCDMLVNSRRLGRYMQTHKAMIYSSLGLREAGKKGNRVQYKLERPKNNEVRPSNNS
jgi:ABC-type oligopeptide transport system ATPase subunit